MNIKVILAKHALNNVFVQPKHHLIVGVLWMVTGYFHLSTRKINLRMITNDIQRVNNRLTAPLLPLPFDSVRKIRRHATRQMHGQTQHILHDTITKSIANVNLELRTLDHRLDGIRPSVQRDRCRREWHRPGRLMETKWWRVDIYKQIMSAKHFRDPITKNLTCALQSERRCDQSHVPRLNILNNVIVVSWVPSNKLRLNEWHNATAIIELIWVEWNWLIETQKSRKNKLVHQINSLFIVGRIRVFL